MQQTKNAKLALWKQRHERYRASELTRRAFCEKHHLKRSTLDYWFCRLRKLEKGADFVEMKPRLIAGVDYCLTVVVAQGYRIEIRKGFDPQLLAEVALALGSLR